MSKLKELEKRLREEPENLGLRVLVAAALREDGRDSDAIELYRSVAIAYRDQGRIQQAVAVCRNILEMVPGDPISTGLLAQLAASPSTPMARARETGSVVAPLLDIPSITPPPPPSNPPTSPPPPIRAATSPKSGGGPAPALPKQAALRAAAVPRPNTPLPIPAPPLIAQPTQPARRSSYEETPLPKPLPYHVADPTTSSLQKMSASEIPGMGPPASDDAETSPDANRIRKTARGSDVDGLANAARRISASLIAAGRRSEADDEEDISIELETRRVPRIDTRELAKISAPPPTVPTERVEPIEIDDEVPTNTVSALGGDDPTRSAKEPTRTTGDLDTEDEMTAPRDVPIGTRPPPLPPPRKK